MSVGSTQLKGVVPDVLLPDPTSFVDSGERTLFHAIRWSTIAPVPYAKVPHGWKPADFAASSAARTGANADLATVMVRLELVLRLERGERELEHRRPGAEGSGVRVDVGFSSGRLATGDVETIADELKRVRALAVRQRREGRNSGEERRGAVQRVGAPVVVRRRDPGGDRVGSLVVEKA